MAEDSHGKIFLELRQPIVSGTAPVDRPCARGYMRDPHGVSPNRCGLRPWAERSLNVKREFLVPEPSPAELILEILAVSPVLRHRKVAFGADPQGAPYAR